MSETRFTPGPWEISWNTFNGGEEHGIYASGELDLKGWQIAKVNYFPTMDSHSNEEAGKANAKLIASAPAMFEELKTTHEVLLEIYNSINNRTFDSHLVQQTLRDLMAKQLSIIEKATS